jgi:hypothetical protein
MPSRSIITISAKRIKRGVKLCANGSATHTQLSLVFYAKGARNAKRNFNTITAMICAYAVNWVMAACRTICYSAAMSCIQGAQFLGIKCESPVSAGSEGISAARPAKDRRDPATGHKGPELPHSGNGVQWRRPAPLACGHGCRGMVGARLASPVWWHWLDCNAAVHFRG